MATTGRFAASLETYSREAMRERILANLNNPYSRMGLDRGDAVTLRRDEAVMVSQPEMQYGSLAGRYHYANGIYSHESLRRHAEWVIGRLDHIEYDFVAVTGKSGMSVAFAALALRQFDLVTIRKDGEQSHGSQVEGEARTMCRYIVIDDFVSSGATLNNIEDALGSWALSRSVQAPRRVGVLEYNHHRFSER